MAVFFLPCPKILFMHMVGCVAVPVTFDPLSNIEGSFIFIVCQVIVFNGEQDDLSSQ